MASRAELLFDEIMKDPIAVIEKMVTDHEQESEILDFKTVGADSDNKKNWAKALSGFANISGGVIVWGVDCRRISIDGVTVDCANELKPADNPVAFVESMRAFHRQATTDPVQGVQITPVIKGDGTGYVVCFVPEGSHKPYRDESSKQYWQRMQDSFAVISHSFLRSLFFPVSKARMVLAVKWEDDNSFICKVTNHGVATGLNLEVNLEVDPECMLTAKSRYSFVSSGLHPEQSFLIQSFKMEDMYRFQRIEVHFIFYMLNHEPQCQRLVLPKMFIGARMSDAGFTVTSIEYAQYKKFGV